MKIRWVAQQWEYGCSLACLAMILGRDQAKIDKDFHTDFGKRGVPLETIREYLQDEGLIVVEKRAYSSGNKQKHNKRMLQPFADAHIVMVQTVADKKINHLAVMDKRGRVYDPDNRKVRDGLHYYYVIAVLGIFWD